MLNTIYDLLDNQFTETKKLRENLEKSEKEMDCAISLDKRGVILA